MTTSSGSSSRTVPNVLELYRSLCHYLSYTTRLQYFYIIEYIFSVLIWSVLCLNLSPESELLDEDEKIKGEEEGEEGKERRKRRVKERKSGTKSLKERKEDDK